MSGAPPILLFDVMDTLVHEPFFVEMPEFFGMSLAELMEVKHPRAWLEFERGEIGEDEFLRGFFADGRGFDHEGFKRVIRASYRWLPGMEGLLGELARGGLVIHALSNYPTWYRIIEERLELSRYLRWTFVSCHTGVRKPDERAFSGAAAQLGVEPARCLFVDDREENCAAARAVGMGAVRFHSAPELRTDLAALGLLAS